VPKSEDPESEGSHNIVAVLAVRSGSVVLVIQHNFHLKKATFIDFSV
jgi:hypothetical protein